MKLLWGLILIMGMAQICAADYAVQVGAFTDASNVNRTVERLQSEGYPAVTDVFTNQNGTKYQCVMAGPYSTRKEAQNVLAKLKLSGWTGFVRTIYKPLEQSHLQFRRTKSHQHQCSLHLSRHQLLNLQLLSWSQR